MYIGHIATALAAKRVDRGPSLGIFTVAACLPDILFSALLFSDLEEVVISPGNTAMVPLAFPHYPYSHSLVGTLVAGGILGGAYWLRRREWRAAVMLIGLSFGHWLLDVVSHTPDMPVGPGGPMLGFGLWYSVAATFIVEGGLFLLGAWLYWRSTASNDRVGKWGFVALIGLLVATYIPSPFGEPPPSPMAVGIVNSVGLGLIVLLTFWVDSHRSSHPAESAGTPNAL